jgi:hypothetical protein
LHFFNQARARAAGADGGKIVMKHLNRAAHSTFGAAEDIFYHHSLLKIGNTLNVKDTPKL